MRYFFYIITFLLVSKDAYSNFELNNNIQNAYSNIISLNFNEAQKFLSQEKEVNPENGLIYLNENYIDFLKIIIDENQDFYDKSRINKNIRINNIKKNDQSSPYFLYSQAEINIQWAFTRIKFNQFFLAAYELQKAYVLLKKNEKLFPEFVLNKKPLGILNILISSIPQEYSWILNIVGIEANINSGFEELYEVLRNCETNNDLEIYKSEIIFYLSFLEMNMRNDKKSKQNLLFKIENCCLNNDLMIFSAARLSNKLGENEKTVKILQNRTQNNSQFDFHYLNYLYAMSKLYQLDFKNAKDYFLKFVNNYNGQNYIKSAYHKLFLISYLTDSIDDQEFYRNLVLEKGRTLIDEDKQAENDMKNNINLNYELLLARILFDGGYYFKALDKLNTINVEDLEKNSDYKIEYYYRLARSNQRIINNQKDKIALFSKVLVLENPSNLYYHPMAALQIGLEYEIIGDKKNAINYFNKVFDYRNYNYENGIKKSAKAGINRLIN